MSPPMSHAAETSAHASAPLTLISHDLCPYVQRAVIALAEKDVAFERIDIDLDHKPDWFRALSPLGKVPLLRVGDDAIFESAVILEYIEETQPNPLHPAAPLARARHRGAVEFSSALLADIWGIETAADGPALDGKLAAAEAKFARLERDLAAGPWFAGARFSLVDAAFAPVFRYFDLFDRFLGRSPLAGKPRVAAWRSALAARPSVRAAVAPNYAERLAAFIDRQDGELARMMRAKV
ncbi:MAG TPA: glutathione S-transferase family protein [Xanthobacteraceae bacterium]|nr:glutathione S-transferase family protein [Xanthobacteraceae bacterium]